MQTTKENPQEKPHLVMKVAIADTFRAIKVGQSVTFDCAEVGTFSTAKGTVSRLNQNNDGSMWSIETANNGATYTVTRLS